MAIGLTPADGAKGPAEPPQTPLVQAPTPETSDGDIALVKSAIENVRRGAASKASEIEASIFDPVAFIIAILVAVIVLVLYPNRPALLMQGGAAGGARA